MKRSLYLIIMLLVITLGGMAQTIGEAFYIYRNDGQFNAFFRDEVDSIVYSNYDADSVYYDEIVAQLVYTPDSVYRIPLAVIDSVGFVQPETVYKENAVPLTEQLFDYLISVDSLSLVFEPSIPSALLPNIGDKLVTMEFSDKIPCGFVGKVKDIENKGDVITVNCDSIAFEEAVSRFYGVAEIVSLSQGDNEARRYLPSKAPIATYTYSFNPNIPDFNLPIPLEGVIKPQKVFRSIEGKASANMNITPTLTGRAVYVIDNLVVPTHYEIHVVVDIKTESILDVAGVAKGDFVKWWLDKDIPMPWGHPLYLAVGPMLEIEGDVALGFKVQADVRHIEDITYYPFAALNPITQMMFNTVDHTTQITRFDVDWQYFALRGSAKVGFKARVGLPVPKHEVAWFGGEFQFGERIDAELNVDFDAIEKAETSTAFYDALKSSSSLSEMSYGGAQFCVMGWRDRLNLKFGRDDYSFGGKRYSGDFLPIFSDTKAEVYSKSETGAKVSSIISNDCLIPYTVGFSLFDESGNRIGEPQWNKQKFWRRNGFTLPYEATFTGLATEKKYKAYPTLRLFGINVLASPCAEIDTHFPVEILSVSTTESNYSKGGFSYEGKLYNYKYNLGVMVVLDEIGANVDDWGYVYEDPNGRLAHISLKEFGTYYIDERYCYYRNQAPSSVILYEYYVSNGDTIYGKKKTYELKYEKFDISIDLYPDHMYSEQYEKGIIQLTIDVRSKEYNFSSPASECGVIINGNKYVAHPDYRTYSTVDNIPSEFTNKVLSCKGYAVVDDSVFYSKEFPIQDWPGVYVSPVIGYRYDKDSRRLHLEQEKIVINITGRIGRIYTDEIYGAHSIYLPVDEYGYFCDDAKIVLGNGWGVNGEGLYLGGFDNSCLTIDNPPIGKHKYCAYVRIGDTVFKGKDYEVIVPR